MDTPDKTPRRFKRYPYGPLRLRLLMPAVAVIAGIVLVATNAGAGGERDAAIWGAALIVLAVIAFLAARWMAKRGL